MIEQDGTIGIRIQDDGPGYSPDVMDRLGDPYLTTRRGRRAQDGGYEGMGLGLFIAKTLLERRGATIAFSNRRRGEDSLSGATVEIRWNANALVEHGQPQ